MVDVVTTPDPRGPAGGSHRTIAVMVIVVALIFLTLFWVMNKGGNNKISDRVDSVPAPTAPATGTASGVNSDGGGTGDVAGGGTQAGTTGPSAAPARSTPADATQPRGGDTGR